MSSTFDIRIAAPPPRGRNLLARNGTRLLNFAAVVGILLLWRAVAAYGLVSPLALPAPGSVVAAAIGIVRHGYAGASLLDHVAASLSRLMAAFVVAAAIGVPLGMAMGTSRAVREIIGPWIELYRPVPSLAYMGVMILWLGVGDTARVALLVLGGLPAIVIGTAEAAATVRTERLQAARSLGIAGMALFRMVILPSSLPGILTALRIASTGIFTTLVAAEMIGANVGLGSMLLTASYQMQMSVVILAVLVLGTAGLLMDRCFHRAQSLLTPWAGRF